MNAGKVSRKIRSEKGQLQYYANIALKVNMKVGGVNHRLESTIVQWLGQVPTMLVGMDVCTFSHLDLPFSDIILTQGYSSWSWHHYWNAFDCCSSY